MSKILIIDTFNFFHRAYYALPPTLTDREGNQTNAIYGVASMLISIFDLINPDYVVAALESKEKTERKKQYEDYKAHRKPMDDELKQQIPMLFDLLEGFKIKTLSVSGYEADDVVGTLVRKFSSDVNVVIASNDRDLWQLVDDNVLIMSPKNNGKEADWVGENEVKAHFGFGPEIVPDYKSLTGDSSDNIPGVKGIGKVTATKLLKAYGTLEGIYDNLDEITGSIHNKLVDHREEAFLSKELAVIEQDLPIEVDLSDCAFDGLDKDSIRDILEKYNFKSLLNRLNELNGSVSEPEPTDPNQLGLF